MPWNFRKVGNKTCAYNKATGKKKGCTTGSGKAYAAALYANALEEKKAPNKITQKDVMSGIRKDMPPPSKPFASKAKYNRKKFKSFKAYWDEDVTNVDGNVPNGDVATAESAGTLGYGSSDKFYDTTADQNVDEPLKYEDESNPGGPADNAATTIQGIEDENFIDHKGPGRPGDSKRHGIKKHSSLSSLDKIVHSKSASPRKKQLAHWQANMRRGHKK